MDRQREGLILVPALLCFAVAVVAGVGVLVLGFGLIGFIVFMLFGTIAWVLSMFLPGVGGW